MLGLPIAIRACLFDLDGVLTQTAKEHAAAWKEMFDEFLAKRGQPLFDIVADYDAYIDGRLRADGTRAFLASRHISLPEGTPDDSANEATVNGLSNRKNAILLKRLRTHGVEVYPGSVQYLHAVRAAGLKVAVVSASANTHEVLAAAGLSNEFNTVIDGIVAQREHLNGKPAPDTYLAAARAVHEEPSYSAVFEDALAGVEAGRAGDFGFVVGVDRVGQRDALLQHGASVVVDDLSELLDKP